MKLRRTTSMALAAAGLVAPLVAYAPAAHATAVCVENDTLTFNPPLGLTNPSAAGTATLAWSKTCPALPGLAGGTSSGTFTYGYVGTCLEAQMTEGTLSLVAAGTGYVMVWTGGAAKAEVLIPNALCPGPITTASGTGVYVSG